MLEDYIKLMQEYPIGTQIEIKFDGHWNASTVTGYSMFKDVTYGK